MIEDEEFSPDELDDEDITGGDASVKPWDPAKIRISTKNFSLRDVVQQIDDDELDLSPDFQRDYVWKERQRTRLVESILLGIPLPAFYFNQDKEGTYQVVDGVQRLSTIRLYMNNEHTLYDGDLEYLKHLNGCSYDALPAPYMRRFRSTQIVVHVIEPQTPDEVRYDIFNRVNTLGSPLSAQEIRHAMSKSTSRSFLKALAESKAFDDATSRNYWRKDKQTGQRVRDGGRMANRELALRFCAFREFSEPDYRKFSGLDAFLVEYTKRLDDRSDSYDGISEGMRKSLAADFERAMVNARTVLGKGAFRRWPPDQRRGPINRAVFESQALALAEYEPDRIQGYAEDLAQELRELFNEAKYSRSVTVGTGDPNAVTYRLRRTRELLVEIVK